MIDAAKYASRIDAKETGVMSADDLKNLIADAIESGKAAGIGVDEYVKFPTAAKFESCLHRLVKITSKGREFIIPVIDVERYYLDANGEKIRETKGVFNLRKLMRTCYSDEKLGGIKPLDDWAQKIQNGEDIISLVAGKTLHGVLEETDTKYLQDFVNRQPQSTSSKQAWVKYVVA